MSYTSRTASTTATSLTNDSDEMWATKLPVLPDRNRKRDRLKRPVSHEGRLENFKLPPSPVPIHKRLKVQHGLRNKPRVSETQYTYSRSNKYSNTKINNFFDESDRNDIEEKTATNRSYANYTNPMLSNKNLTSNRNHHYHHRRQGRKRPRVSRFTNSASTSQKWAQPVTQSKSFSSSFGLSNSLSMSSMSPGPKYYPRYILESKAAPSFSFAGTKQFVTKSQALLEEKDFLEDNAGIFRLHHPAEKICWYGYTWDFDTARVERMKQLAEGTHPHFWLQEAYTRDGRDSVRFQIVERIKWPLETIQKKVKMGKGTKKIITGKRERVRLDVFLEKLKERNEHHHQKYLRKRLSKTLVIWRKKQIEPNFKKWHFWVKASAFYYKLLFSIHLQRLYRGRKGRRKARRRFRYVMALRIQSIYRGNVGRRKARNRRALIRSAAEYAADNFIKTGLSNATVLVVNISATKLQAFSRMVLAKRLTEKIRREILELNAVLTLQSNYRLHRARGVLSLKKEQHAAAVSMQSMFRSRKAKQQVHQMREDKSAVTLQMAWRQKLARRSLNFRKLEVQRQKEERAALRIQTRYRVRHGKLVLQLKRQAKKIRDEEERLAATRMQCLFRTNRSRMELANRKEAKRKAEIERRNKAALRVQCQYRARRGRLAYHLKKQAKAIRDEEERIAAEKMQSSWRRQLAYRKRAELEFERLTRAAIRVQARYRAHHGKLAYHLKKQAKKQREEEERLASTRVQALYRRRLAKQELARRRRMKEEREREIRRRRDAAVRIQAWYRGRTGRFSFHMKMQAKRLREEEEQREREEAAIRLQSVYRGRLGKSYTDDLRRQRAEENTAATRIQCSFRSKRARGVYMERKAKYKEHALKILRNKELRAAIKLQCAWRSKLARREISNRRDLHMRKLQKMKEEEAAIRLQCAFRGKQAKKHLEKRKKEYALALEKAANEEERQKLREEQEKELSAIKMQNAFRSKIARSELQKRKHKRDTLVREEEDKRKKEEENLAALKLQSMYRGWDARVRYEELLDEKEEEERLARIKAEKERKVTEGEEEDIWYEYFDDENQVPYFYNESSGKSTYRAWEEKYDVESGYPWWEHRITKESTWESPYGEEDAAAEQPDIVEEKVREEEEEEQIVYPEGWSAHWSEEHERYYYYNEYTEDTSWEEPEGTYRVSSTAQVSGSAWSEHWDETEGRYYYYNSETQETTWERPPAMDDISQGEGVEESSSSAEEPLWSEHYDESSGKAYYFNKETNETTWERPIELDQHDGSSYYATEATNNGEGDQYGGTTGYGEEFYREETNSWDEQTAADPTSYIENGLESQWQEFYDEEQQVKYWYNEQTGESTYEEPTQTTDWELQYDNEGNPYYYNKQTGETKWA
eukprot:g2682.t1